MTPVEFQNIILIFENLEKDLEEFIRSNFDNLKDLSLEELQNLYDNINKVRFGSSSIYAAALGKSNKVYEELCKRRGVVPNQVEKDEVKITPNVVKVPSSKKTTPIDMESLAKMIAQSSIPINLKENIEGEKD